jgi:hypothetical protein
MVLDQRRDLQEVPAEELGDGAAEGVVVVAGDHVSGAGYVDGLGVGNQLLNSSTVAWETTSDKRPYEKCWGIDPSGSVDQQVADCVELLRSVVDSSRRKSKLE